MEKNKEMESVSVMQSGSIVTLLYRLDMGNLMHDYEEAATKVVEAVMQSGKKASLTLKLDFEVDVKTGMTIVTPAITKKMPAKSTKSTYLFATPDGKLSHDDPKQHKLFA
jgi:hypothetical protein